MKKIYLTLALAVGLMTTSCELDIEPVGYLPTDSALETPSSFNAARATLYAALKGCVSGNSFINSTDVQSDQFNAMAGFSNTLGDMYRWDFTTQTGAFASVYGAIRVSSRRLTSSSTVMQRLSQRKSPTSSLTVTT